jgi:hypothetical protein
MLSGVPVPHPLALCVVFSPSLFLLLPFFIWTFYCMSS